MAHTSWFHHSSLTESICCISQPGSWTAQRSSGGGASPLSPCLSFCFSTEYFLPPRTLTRSPHEALLRPKNPQVTEFSLPVDLAEVWGVCGLAVVDTNCFCCRLLSRIAVCGEGRGVESQLSCLGSGALASPLGTSTFRLECWGKLNCTNHLIYVTKWECHHDK